MSDTTSRGSAFGASSPASCQSVWPAATVTCSNEVAPNEVELTWSVAVATPPLRAKTKAVTTSGSATRVVRTTRPRFVSLSRGARSADERGDDVEKRPSDLVTITAVLMLVPFRRVFVPDTRPGVPDTKLCSEHTFDCLEIQDPSSTQPTSYAQNTRINVCLSGDTRIQFRLSAHHKTSSH